MILGVLGLLLLGCNNRTETDDKKIIAKPKLYTVVKKDLTQNLYFSGVVEPVKLTTVASPVEGAVMSRHFSYGQDVKKGQLLVRLNSDKLEQNYSNALSSYLKEKDGLASARAKFTSSKELYRLGIISKESHDSARSALNMANVAYFQAHNNLEKFSKTTPTDFSRLEKLSLSDMKKVAAAFKLKYDYLPLEAPVSGVALLPPEDGKPIVVGSQVKLGQVMLAIGDVSGISTKINISEVDIHKVKIGARAVVTGVAFPGKVLQGYIASVSAQAQSKSGFSGGLPTFHARVIVPNIKVSERTHIHIGMSAKVKLLIDKKQQLMIPINAVSYTDEGEAWVKKWVNGKAVRTMVKTGDTTVKEVTILSGLKAGDKILYYPGGRSGAHN